MADTMVLYSTPEHLNSMLVLARFIGKHHPSVPVIILSYAAECAVAAGPSVTYHRLPIPTLPADLTKDHLELYFEIPRVMNPSLHHALQEISRKATIKAFVIDFFCNAAFEVSTGLGIPTYFYVSTGGFGLSAFLYFPTLDETIAGDIGELDDFLEIPGCPLVHSSDFPKGMHFRQSNIYKHFLSTGKNLRRAAGIVANTFDALEYRSKEALANGLCVPGGPTPPVYLVGPLVAGGGSKTGGEECLKWLDKQPSKSVIFLCFGRRGLFSGEQLKEMAVGLENSGHRFLWSVRNPPGKQSKEPDLDDLLPEGFLERTKDRGFVVTSWAPQTAVLSHESVAGFVTHCGRSSFLEAVSFGVPMIAWPLYAEQRMNRAFMVEEMQLALPVEAAAEGLVAAAELEKRVKELMESKAGRAVRQRITEMKHAAQAAVRPKGSALLALEKFITAVTRV